MKTKKVLRNGYEFQVPFYHEDFRWRLKGAKAKAPPPVAVAPTPRELDEDVRLKDQARRRQRISAAGRGGTILTQGQSLSSGNATLLGRGQA